MIDLSNTNLKWVRLPDFGTILINSNIENDEFGFVAIPGMVFSAPSEWTMAHIMKALGAFKSVGDARRNGWNTEIEIGFFPIVVRLNKIQGIIWIWKAA